MGEDPTSSSRGQILVPPPYGRDGQPRPQRGGALPKATQRLSGPYHLTPLLNTQAFSLGWPPVEKKPETYRDFLLASDQSPSLHQPEQRCSRGSQPAI